MGVSPPRLFLVRHGATEWSVSGQHTGRTDIPLTDEGRRQGEALGRRLSTEQFALVLVSPLRRAAETVRLAGFGDGGAVEPDLVEWDYGVYDSLTSADIRETRPDWNLWADGVPGGETIDEVAERAGRVLERARAAAGDVALFAHGHVLRVIAALALGQAAAEGAHYYLHTASVSVLGFERDVPVIEVWNDLSHLFSA